MLASPRTKENWQWVGLRFHDIWAGTASPVIGLVTCAEITREPVCGQADNILILSIQVGQQTCDLAWLCVLTCV